MPPNGIHTETTTRSQKNIWVAAGDGDLNRVRELIESGVSPNAPDPFTYTPMHAAASYDRLEVLEYLIEQGGDVNVEDSDGDTPLYTVESLSTAQWLVQHGATVDMKNNEDLSPAEHLEEDYPEIALFLRVVAEVAEAGLPGENIVSATMVEEREEGTIVETEEE